MAKKSLRERLENLLYPDPNSGCFIYFGACGRHGHGLIHDENRKTRAAHRVAWELAGNDPVPALRHRCDVPCCCNPEHLEPGTHQENMADMARRGRGIRGRFPYGVRPQPNGRFKATVKFRGRDYSLGAYDTMQEASAVALAKKIELYANP